MATEDALRSSPLARDYDRKAEEYDWRGPEVVFGLTYAFTQPGESVLDLGIGTGLGSVLFHKAGLHVHGMDISPEMLEACREKGFAADLREHDLTVEPYPYDEASLDHAVCLGVLHSIADLRPVFRQVARVLRDHGLFAFVVADRGPEEEARFAVVPECGQPDPITAMHRHSAEEITGLLSDHGFVVVRSLEFPVPMDRGRTQLLRAKAYVARRETRIGPSRGSDGKPPQRPWQAPQVGAQQ